MNASWIALLCVLVLPGVAAAAGAQPLDVPVWTVVPFVTLLLLIAILPLIAAHFWESNFRKALVSLALSLPVVAYLFHLEQTTGQPGMDALAHALLEYGEFIILLAALYTVSGGIVLQGDLVPSPVVNTLFLAVGAVLANLIGTTGASMLLIRPFLRINARRIRTRHLPVFFIFVVSNLGGLLTPLGDPPLFLGFLHGVEFFWTLALFPHWSVAVGTVLAVFFLWDVIAYRREPGATAVKVEGAGEPLRLCGLANFLFLAGILAAVLLQSESISQAVNARLNPWLGGVDVHLERPWGSVVMVVISLLSLLVTPRPLRQANGFHWGPILEVAVLFAGIFITLVPALHLLAKRGMDLGLSEPWQYFWLTGGLSSFLDNAPTYLTFVTVAAGSSDFSLLVLNRVPGIDGPLVLQAISCGAVFMGANTYIGNGPNFMVKAIAESAGYATPSFFGYMLYSCLILLPVFGLITWMFFLG